MRRPVAVDCACVVFVSSRGLVQTMSLNLAPDRPDAPWTPATTPQGEIVAGSAPASGQPKAGNYVLAIEP